MSFGTPHSLFLTQSVCFYAARDVIYLNNAKAGCSTIKSAMIHGIRADQDRPATAALLPAEVHGRNAVWSYDFRSIGARTKTFSVVRNPFVRVVSAYLDKIAKKNSLRFQFLTMNRLGVNGDVSFIEFLRILDRNPHFSIADQHYRQQVENLHLGSFAPNRVFFLENFGRTNRDLTDWLGWSLPFSTRDPHATGAAEKLASIYTDEGIDIVRRLYADDFAQFGYSTDLADAGQAPADFIAEQPIDRTARISYDVAIAARHGEEDMRAIFDRIGASQMSLRDHLILSEAGFAAANDESVRDRALTSVKSARGGDLLIGLLYLARAAESAGNTEEAAQYLVRILAICPYFVHQRHRLGLHLIQLGRIDAAKAQRFALQHGSQRKELAADLDRLIDQHIQGATVQN